MSKPTILRIPGQADEYDAMREKLGSDYAAFTQALDMAARFFRRGGEDHLAFCVDLAGYAVAISLARIK